MTFGRFRIKPGIKVSVEQDDIIRLELFEGDILICKESPNQDVTEYIPTEEI